MVSPFSDGRHKGNCAPAELRAARLGDDSLVTDTFEDARIQKYESSRQSRVGTIRAYLGRLWRRFSRKTDRIDKSSSIIIVVGPPGAGRAEFIGTISGQSVSPATKSIRAVTCNNPDGSDSRIVFIDLPSLETGVMLDDIEVQVREWIKTRGGRIENFSGIIYVQSITDRSFRDPPLTPFSQFLSVEGTRLCQRCVIATTMWDQIDPATGTERENELKRVWKDMIRAGSRMVVLQNTLESAKSLVQSLLAPPLEAPSNELSVADVVLNELPTEPGVPAAESPSMGDRQTPELPSMHSSYALGRPHDQIVILTVGKTGSGKSKTINRLIGESILDVAKPGDGPTTMHPSRVTASFKSDLSNVDVAFDEISAHADTDGTRQQFAALLRAYAETYFPPQKRDQDDIPFEINAPDGTPASHNRVFPNVILIVATWESVKRDENDVPHLTSDIGQLMVSLKGLDLIDPERTNVIVVVTKSMASYSTDYEDYEDDEKKNGQWRKDADKKTDIINDLQQKVFPGSAKWSVVFIENGGGRQNLKSNITLPNGETSHQNLLDAMHQLVSAVALDQMSVVNEGLALRLLAGEQPSTVSTFRQDLECDVKNTAAGTTLCDAIQVSEENPLSRRQNLDCDVKHSAAGTTLDDPNSNEGLFSPRIEELARNTIGVTFNPVNGKFGRSCVLALNPSDIRIALLSGRQSEKIYSGKVPIEDPKLITSLLQVDFKMRDIVGFASWYPYSSSGAVTSALTSGSRLHITKKAIATAEVVPLRPRLSQEMIEQIERLPRWSDGTMDKYYDFFDSYGTHVVLKAVFGGVLRVLSRDQTNLDVIEAHQSGRSQHSSKSNNVEETSVFMKGGDAVGPEFSAAVEQLSAYHQDKSVPVNWPELRVKWLEAVETDPAFCPDDRQTDYWWLYNLDGLTDIQRMDLERASVSYLRT